ncbi:MAG: hypothetical protein R3B09_35145, partial [Nannocystaceae bacterium]
WIRLGDIAELSTLFIGFEGLPRVFKAREAAPAATPSISGSGIAPPPDFGEDLEEIPPFGVGNEPRASQSGPMSMLEAVTKAVSTPARAAEDDAPAARKSSRSEPILVADLAASQSGAPRLPGTPSQLTEPSLSDAPTGRVQPPAGRGQTGPQAPTGPLEGSLTNEVNPSAAAEPSLQAEISAPPPPEPRRGGLGWVAALGVAAGLAVMLGIPSIRAKIFGGGDAVAGPGAPPKPLAAVVDEDPVDLQQADQALYLLGLAETTKAQSTLQKIIDERVRRSESVDDLRLAQAELILSRALSFKIALSIDPAAVDGTARSRAQEDETWATDLVQEIPKDKVKDETRWQRVQGLLAVVKGHNAEAAAAVPRGEDELGLVIAAATLWESTENPVPPGIISGIQGLQKPSTLARSILALALWRGGDTLGAMKVVLAVQQEVVDQPLANTLHKALTQALAEEQDPVEVTPPDPSETPPPVEVKKPNPPTSTGPDFGPAETRTQRGCDKVRSGDASGGIKLLLAAIDANQVGIDTYLCLGEGYSKLGNHGSSLAFFERALNQAPKHRAALEGAAHAAERLKRTSKATDLYKRLLAVDPGNEAAKAFLGGGGDPPPATTGGTSGGASGGTGESGGNKPDDGGLLPVKGGEKPFSEGP